MILVLCINVVLYKKYIWSEQFFSAFERSPAEPPAQFHFPHAYRYFCYNCYNTPKCMKNIKNKLYISCYNTPIFATLPYFCYNTLQPLRLKAIRDIYRFCKYLGGARLRLNKIVPPPPLPGIAGFWGWCN